jgi:hypothetical protein
MFKFKVKANMSGVLDKEMVESFMPLEDEDLHHEYSTWETKQVQAKSIVEWHHKENKLGYLLSHDIEQAHVKTTRQTNIRNYLNTFFYFTIGIAFFIVRCITEGSHSNE